MISIDLNCDLGEGAGNDELIMPYISSANIACGYHAGDEKTMWQTAELAARYNVAIGAHPSFFDQKNFGRNEVNLSPEEIYDLIIQQLMILDEIAGNFNLKLNHVKPHGALYNMSAKTNSIAKTIAQAVKDFDEKLVLFGLSSSHSITEAKAIGLKTASEVFADRTYQDDGNLTLRSQPNALIEDSAKAVQQVLQIIIKALVTTVTGKSISIIAETICIHGDGKQAVEFAKEINRTLKENNIEIKAIS